ncbi:hypothetical protein [Spirosoma sp.]|uniref:hypothetical protein n=1 Tax=Spirosoma sp. TaxID=1899569 RepID=UPI003B3B5E25
MAANVLYYHNQNPYSSGKQRQHIVIFSATDYQASLLAILSPISLRVLLLLASKLNWDGYAVATLDELASLIQTPKSYVNKGILELAKYDLIKKKKRSEYWIRPDVFRPATIEL